MENEIERLVDCVCKGYETVDKWITRYDHLFDDYEAMRAQYEENRAHKAYTNAKLLARCANLEESVVSLKSTVSIMSSAMDQKNTDNANLQLALEESERKLIRYKRRENIRMGMQIFNPGE